jgi:hypothetical protein
MGQCRAVIELAMRAGRKRPRDGIDEARYDAAFHHSLGTYNQKALLTNSRLCAQKSNTAYLACIKAPMIDSGAVAVFADTGLFNAIKCFRYTFGARCPRFSWAAARAMGELWGR